MRIKIVSALFLGKCFLSSTVHFFIIYQLYWGFKFCLLENPFQTWCSWQTCQAHMRVRNISICFEDKKTNIIAKIIAVVVWVDYNLADTDIICGVKCWGDPCIQSGQWVHFQRTLADHCTTMQQMHSNAQVQCRFFGYFFSNC